MSYRLPLLLFVLLPALSVAIVAQQIRGDYIETRNADVYTGQCFANSEVNLVGNEAILAWHIREGSWSGVPLARLSVAAAVRASGTLGDPYENPYPAKSVLIVDSAADERQRVALQDFAHHMAGELLNHIERIETAPIQFDVSDEHHGAALVRAGQFATIQTRSLGGQDHICGNEVTFYPPLTEVAHSMPVVAVTDAYDGPGLDVSWNLHGKRSAFLGTFAR